MFKNERQQQIINILKSEKSASVTRLAIALEVSEATVRRDLKELESADEVIRSHGGASLKRPNTAHGRARIRAKKNINQKRMIAEHAVDFIKDDSTLFIDSSTSAEQVISLLQNVKDVTIITNSIENCLKAMQNNNLKVLLCGGEATGTTNALIGHDTIKFLQNYRANLCIISCGGVSHDGATERSREQAEIKRVMLKNSKMRLLLCDSSKLGKTRMCKIADFCDFDYLITDSEIPADLEQLIINSGCKILK